MASPGPEPASDVTRVLARWSSGDAAALAEATELVYPELRRIAEAYLRRERTDHTLQPTALINEAYLRLVSVRTEGFDSRRQFFALAARLMRQILVDHARSAKAGKRGGDAIKVPVNESIEYSPGRESDFLVLDEAISRLATFNARKAQLIELRYFGGLSVEETGEILGISAATVSREQRMAEAWLNDALAQPPPRPSPAPR